MQREKEWAIDGPTKWIWKMKFCKAHGLPPAKDWAWEDADDAFNFEIEQLNTNAIFLKK